MEIPGYRIEKEIGRGGMATVYLAVQESLDRQVALKVMNPVLAADSSFGERFMREARLVAQLAHPHIMTVFEVGSAGDLYYMAIELVMNGDLRGLIEQGPVATPDAQRILRQVGGALDYAHSKGIVHRDIKPENILFRKDGTAVLADFGIARTIDANTMLTVTGMSIGTPHYMSPEQARGKEIDGRSDIYSMGIVLYEMLTGNVPYDAQDSFAIALKQINDPPPILPDICADWQPLLSRMLAKEKENRVELCESLFDPDLQAVVMSPPRPVQVIPKNSGSRPAVKSGKGLWWGLGGAMAGLVVAGGLFYFFQMKGPLPAGGGGSGTVVVPRTVSQVKPVVQRKTELQTIIPARVEKKPTVVVSPPPPPGQRKVVTTPVVTAQPVVEKVDLKAVEIMQLLALAERAVAEKHLTLPKGKNALEYYQRVLRLDPRDNGAIRGLEKIGKTYLDWSEKAISQQEFSKARQYFSRYSDVTRVLSGKIGTSLISMNLRRDRLQKELAEKIRISKKTKKKATASDVALQWQRALNQQKTGNEASGSNRGSVSGKQQDVLRQWQQAVKSN